MSTKTSIKRIALVAVSALGFGVLSMVPAGAAVTATAFKVAAAGTNFTAATNAAADVSTVTAWTRTGQTISISNVSLTGAAGTAKWRIVQTDAADRTGNITNVTSLVAAATTTGSFTATAAMDGKYFFIQTADDGTNTDTLLSQANGGAGFRLRVVDAGAPRSLTFASPALADIAATNTDYTNNVTVKDANGVNTILLDNEAIQLTVGPETGAAGRPHRRSGGESERLGSAS